MALDQASKELNAELQEVDQATDKLRATFEQFFQGIERQPPTTEREALKRRVLKLHTTSVRNTELRFRINQMVAKFNTYQNYWSRVLRQIEEGTYHRDVFKARYRSMSRKEHEAPQPAAEPPPEEPRQPAASRTPVKRPAAGLSDDNVNAIYNAYIMAKRRCKEETGGLTREALARSLRKQIPSIKKQYKCKRVEFKVAIKGGKAILKAVPRF